MTRRVFVGIGLSRELLGACIELQRQSGQFSPLPARLIAPNDLHVTLVPPWNLVDRRATDQSLQAIAARHAPFTLNLLSLGPGPSRAKARMLWVRCKPSAPLLELREALCLEIGRTDEFSFVPHITLARYQRSRGPRPAPVKTGPQSGPSPGFPLQQPAELRLAMTVDRITLFQSPNRGGAGYRHLRSFALRGLDGCSGVK